MITARTLTLREISHRRGNFLLGSLAVAMAICGFALTLARLRAFDAETAAQIEEFERRTATDMATLEDEIRKSMKGLGFNIFIFPKGQELAEVYAEGFASKTMPEEFVTRLAASEVVKVNHLLPSLTQKITWPEQKRTIVLVGTRGEVPIGERAMKAPLIDPVPPGEAVLGFELQQSLGLQAGDQIRLMGHEFKVAQVHSQRGSADDITIWLNLAEAQELMGKPGLINAILALECNCASVTGSLKSAPKSARSYPTPSSSRRNRPRWPGPKRAIPPNGRQIKPVSKWSRAGSLARRRGKSSPPF